MKVITIAELGINAHGSLDKAKRMIREAATLGVDYVKGQYYDPVRVLGRTHPDLAEAQLSQFKQGQHEELARWAKTLGTKYFVSVFDVKDVKWAAQFGAMKIASRMNTRQEFIDAVEAERLPTFMSVQPMQRALIPLRFQLLWCVREYPSRKDQILQYPYRGFGLSSHCPDWEATLEAVKLGAHTIENHVTESSTEVGCDISSSLSFDNYAKLLTAIRNAQTLDR